MREGGRTVRPSIPPGDATAGRPVQAFDGTGPLPEPGVTIIEASAGTGKTYTLTSLVVRAVCDGLPLSGLLAVTFTRMATGELRDRIRGRMVAVHAQLAAVVAGTAPAADPLVAALAAGSSEEVGLRVGRLSDALADFDAATIATTHGFCQLVLHGLGVAGDMSLETELLEDPSDLVAEVVDDLYLRWGLGHRAALEFSRDIALHAAVEATRNPDITVIPVGGDGPSDLLGRLAVGARREVAARLVAGDHLTYDNLLFRLSATLASGDRGAAACERLRRSYPMVLVDEFQDTDPIQWEILRQAFSAPPTRLILIGDPKQAIYAFRGADVHAYLQAASEARSLFTLSDNWRSDQPLLDAMETLFSPLEFGHPGIPFRTVRAAEGRSETGLHGAPAGAPARFRLVDDRQAGIGITPSKSLLRKPELADWIAGDVAADVAALLQSGATVSDCDGGPRRPLVAADVAVLTRTNRQAVGVRDALRAAGVPSVVAGLESVFASEAAAHWLTLLEALQEPTQRSRAAAVALTPFLGLSPTEVAAADEGLWETVHDGLHRWAAVLAERGVATLYRTVTAEQAVPARVLAVEGGERLLTDLGHVAHLLHSEAGAAQGGAATLRSWLAARIRTAAEDQSDADERSRRLDSDAEAVQVLTVHRAKGLEFAVVYCPYMWDGGFDSGSGPVVFHDQTAPPEGSVRTDGAGGPADGAGRRTLDVGCVGDDREAKRLYRAHADLAKAERRGEELRLMYVAVTRARHQVVLWWGRAQDSRHSPLARILLCRKPSGEVGEARAGEPGGAQIRAALEALAERRPGLISLETATGARPPLVRPGRPDAGVAAGEAADGDRPADDRTSDEGAPGEVAAGEAATGEAAAGGGLATARFDRRLDRRWRRASFTSITAVAHGDADPDSSVGSEPEEPGLRDEPDPGPEVGAGPAPIGASPDPGAPVGDGGTAADGASGDELSRPVPLADLPGGTAVGTFVHRVLERCDFAAPDLAAELSAAVASAAERDGPAADPSLLIPGLQSALTTPLGPLLPGVRLADIGRRDRLDELSFELPLAGGDRPTGTLDTAAVAGVVRRHLDPAGPLGGYADRLTDPLLATELRGYLTGSLDLVFRRREPGGEPRWYLADYKTNWLGTGPGPLTPQDYRPAALAAEMARRHYPLQALLYMVALHRYLRWRQPGYRPDVHLGGVLYLFLRGMTGDDGPVIDDQPSGVFSWAVPPALVEDLSQLFDSGAQS